MHGISVKASLRARRPVRKERTISIADISPAALRVVAQMVRAAYFEGYDTKRRNIQDPEVFNDKLSTNHDYARQWEWSTSEVRDEIEELRMYPLWK